MTRDILFLLPPGFLDNGRREFCPECAELWGFLAWHPAMLHTVEVRYQGIGHPREGLVALLGPGRWNCPTLMLDARSPDHHFAGIARANGYAFIDNARAIAQYWSLRFGTPVPRGV